MTVPPKNPSQMLPDQEDAVIHLDTGSSTIDRDNYLRIGQIADALAKLPSVTVTLIGDTDSRG